MDLQGVLPSNKTWCLHSKMNDLNLSISSGMAKPSLLESVNGEITGSSQVLHRTEQFDQFEFRKTWASRQSPLNSSCWTVTEVEDQFWQPLQWLVGLADPKICRIASDSDVQPDISSPYAPWCWYIYLQNWAIKMG